MDSEEYHQVFPQSVIPGNFANRNVAKRQTDFFELIGTGESAARIKVLFSTK